MKGIFFCIEIVIYSFSVVINIDLVKLNVLKLFKRCEFWIGIGRNEVV